MIVLEWDREEYRLRLQILDEEGDIAVQRAMQRMVNLSTRQPDIIP